MEALAAAAGGTLCVWRRQQPDDFDEVVSALQGPYARALLVVCAHAHALPRGNDIASRIVPVVRSIVLPPSADRARELHRVHRRVRSRCHRRVQGRVARAGRPGVDREQRGWLPASDRVGNALDRARR
jgi:hypothetical protein